MRLIDADKLKRDLRGYNAYVEQTIDRQPTVEPTLQRVENVGSALHAHWDEDMRGYACSFCYGFSDFAADYCPYCGAKMDEVKINNSAGIDLWMTEEKFMELYNSEMDEEAET